jgi:predicted acylesterase/phospholipase RssA
MARLAEPLEIDRLACITIQGGGVFGINLLGQLQAVLEMRYIPVALSGNSAGAIVAALHWARLMPGDILDLFIQQATRPSKLTDLLGPFEHGDGPEFALDDLRQFQDRLEHYRGEFRSLREDLAFGPFVKAISILRAYLKYRNRLVEEWELVERLCRRCGMFAGDRLEQFIERALRRSPYVEQNLDLLPENVRRGDGPLTFGHFQLIREKGSFNNPTTHQTESGPYLPPLFLAATNVTTRSLELINSVEARYQDWSVARAVRSSAGFPVFFRPVAQVIDKNEYSFVDGGMIANYPAFVFGEQFRGWLAEKLPTFDAIVSRPWLHLGLRLTAQKPTVGRAGEATDPRAFLRAMSELLTSQARNELEEKLAKYVRRSIPVELSLAESGGPAGVLDVEELRTRDLEAMYHNGRRAGLAALGEFSFRYPPAAAVEPLLEDLLGVVEGVFGPDSRDLKLRSNIFVPKEDQLVLHYRARMEPPPAGARIEDGNQELNWDWDLVLPFSHGLTGFCFIRRMPLLCNLAKFKTLYEPGREVDPRKLFGFDERTQNKIRGDRSWLLSVPIFDPDALTIRPLETSFAEPPAVEGHRLEGQYYKQYERIFDGPVFGVLNLDAGWDYVKIDLSDDPERCLTDPRIRAVIALMQRQALHVGALFSKEFPRRA